MKGTRPRAASTFFAKLCITLRQMDKTRFDRLDVKLFAAIAGAIAALTLGAYLVFSWSFERGFVQYLHRADEMRLELMIERLADGYAREGDWAWIANDRQRWIEMSREALGLPRPSEPQQSAAAPPTAAGSSAMGLAQSTARSLPLTLDPRLMLFDADRRQLIGRPESAAAAKLKPIAVRGDTVGYLGYVPRPELIESVERVYLQRQRVAFGAIALGMLVAAVLLGAGLAHWLTRRVHALARGTNALSQGDYDVRLGVQGHDELAQLARDFNTLAATLAAAREARQQWIADIAHELRTPLSVLRGELESLQDGVRPLDQAAVASLSGEAARLARLVEDLHTLSMSDLGALSYHKAPVDVSELIADLADTQGRAVAERGLQLETQVEENARVLADPTRLEQVFANLLQNSLRYTDAPGTISIAVQRAGGLININWEDSAPGVPVEALTRLTDRLYRLESSRSRAGGGSGLGLAIAKAIVEGHGGTLAAKPSRLGGLAIEIALPAYSDTNAHG
jgi:two-component system, OmpR family, sensor histidine kinase BaeS